ncbi:flagellar assembly protein FliW [Dactylosporangium sp. AC04546]|uniref:flagellar assembly protein FliW n=1 Tax=Dactylosporangium sp. AC04546 TaxID=2862460 RepID=UPI001EE14B38|nr:flagellar assembly protein FliW [Dactylosporangium sp. AC04546]WVK82626.1 flagellar assembly protein FliW [Dactylosporangium sp. AC04546]
MSVATVGPETTTLPVIDFVAPMPGFPEDRRFVLVRLDEVGMLYALTSVDSAGLRFLVVPPARFFPDYAPEVDDDTLAALGVADQADVLVLLVITAGDGAEDATVNLMAPIVLDQRSRRAVQLVLSKSGLPVRQRLLVA